jgi:tetratricopeptide (TPR) repeat protein
MRLRSDSLAFVVDSPDFGDRVRVGRIAAKLSQEELSAQSGVSVRAISDLERGRTRWPHPASVLRLADALQLTGPARAEFIAAAGRRLPRIAPGNGAPVSGGRVVPRQLPPAVPAFAGRSSELATLSHVLSRPGGTAVITAIGGTAGVGKTALALHWAHQVTAEFPDGQLYVNLHGFGPSGSPVSPGSAVRVLLEGLDVPPARLPHSEEGQLNLYRTLLVGKRMLVVLDNARDEGQVRPLLPGSPTCRVVVTSRNQLAGLTVLDAAHPLRLDVLTEAEAWDLLQQRLGPERLRGEDGAVYQIIKASAYLPLALSIVAGLAVLRPELPVTDIAAELTAGQGLDAFTAGEPAADIRTVLSWSYRQLGDDAARTFRLAGLHPGPSLDRYAAAALTGMALDRAEQALLTLTEGGLMQQAGPGRFGMHDLLREYARELSAAHDGELEQRAALTALFDFYLYTALTARTVMFPTDRQVSPGISPPATPIPSLVDYAQARDWLDTELTCLIAISGYAAENGWLSHAMKMSPALSSYLGLDFRFTEAVIIHQRAIKAAALADDHSAEGNAIISLAGIDYRRGRFLDAIERYQQALRHFEEIGDRTGQVAARHSLSATYQTQGKFRQAAADLRTALAFYREVGNRVMEARALYDFGSLHLRLGRYKQASRCFRQALTAYQEAGDRRFEAHLLMKVGFVDLRLGHSRQASDRLQEALVIVRDRRDLSGETDVLRHLGMVSIRQGDHEQAISYLQETLALSREIDNRHGVAATLSDLGLVRLRHGDRQTALRDLHQALSLARELQDPELTAAVLNSLGEAFSFVGQPAQGLEWHADALKVAAGTRHRYEATRAQAGLGSAHDALGDHADAVRHWQLAHDAYVRMGIPEAADIRHLLDS